MKKIEKAGNQSDSFEGKNNKDDASDASGASSSRSSSRIRLRVRSNSVLKVNQNEDEGPRKTTVEPLMNNDFQINAKVALNAYDSTKNQKSSTKIAPMSTMESQTDDVVVKELIVQVTQEV